MITFIDKIKKIHPKIRTYHFEEGLVLVVLVLVGLFAGKSPIEWIGVLAVFFTFKHTVIAERLQEAEAERAEKEGLESVTVECYPKLGRDFLIKECLWFVYFILLGAWSALAGVVIFLLYPVWRKYYRKHKPLSKRAERKAKR
jgi:phosphatidylglycerophosphate synthase